MVKLNAKMVKEKYKCKLLYFHANHSVVSDHTVDYSGHYEISNLEDSLVT
jgi:hypothetical protein